jgi:phage tail tape-measure protein
MFHGIRENYMDDNTATQAGTNRDPITGAPGAHPVGVGLGAAVGGIAAGAAAGTLAAGPIGTVVGAAAGAIAGGLSGKAVAEHFDPTKEGTDVARQLRPPATEHDLRTTTHPLIE